MGKEKKKNKIVIRVVITIGISLGIGFTMKAAGNVDINLDFGNGTENGTDTPSKTENGISEDLSDEIITPKNLKNDANYPQSTQLEQDSPQQAPTIHISKKPIDDSEENAKSDIQIEPVPVVKNDKVNQNTQQNNKDIQTVVKKDTATNDGALSDDVEDTKDIIENENITEDEDIIENESITEDEDIIENESIIEDEDIIEDSNDNDSDNDSELDDEYSNDTLSVKSSCQVVIESQSQVILFSDKKINMDSTINIAYVDPDTDEETDMGSYKVSEIVNEEDDSSESEYTNYINMHPGVFIFNFEDCNFEDINFYIINNDKILSNDLEGENEDEYEEDNDITVPSKEEYEIEMDNENTLYRISIMPSQTFLPIFEFNSEYESDYVVRLIDYSEKELFSIKLECVGDDNAQTISPPFMLEDGEQYYLELECLSSDEYFENMCYFKINKSDVEDDIHEIDSIKKDDSDFVLE